MGKYDIKTPAGKVWAALRGDDPQSTPFTAYEIFLSQSETERSLRNRGLCILRRVNSYKIEYRGINHRSVYYTEKGREMVRVVYETPYGELSALKEKAGSSYWNREFLFKSPDDYKKLYALIRSMTAVPCYDFANEVIRDCGNDFVIRDNLPLEPLQHFISSDLMDMTDFCYEWLDNQDELLKLYGAFVDFNRAVYKIIADGPMEISNYGGNVIPQIIGREVFEKYYMPHYEEAAEVLHKAGMLIGCHFDADNTPIMDLIAKTPLDYIEAYDPGISPSLSEAIKVFEGKAIWLNWPCKWHHASSSEVKEYAQELLCEAGGYKKLIIGITEDIPPENFFEVMEGIAQGIEAFHS